MIDQVAIGVAAVSLLRRQAHVSPRNDDWAQVRQLAPEPIWRYILEVDAEFAAATSSHGEIQSDAWLKQHHPAFDDVLEGLARAVQKFGISPDATQILTFTQGYMIQWATARLGMVYATERPGAGVTTATVIDRVVQERADADLLGWTIRECNQHWADPCAFLEQWHTHMPTSVDRVTLGKAGLFDAELALLEAVEE